MTALFQTLRAAIYRQIVIYRATVTAAKMHEILEDSGKNAALFRTYAITRIHKLHSMTCEQVDAEVNALYERYVKLKHA